MDESDASPGNGSLAALLNVGVAEQLAERISGLYGKFRGDKFVGTVRAGIGSLSLFQRVDLIASALHASLPPDLPAAIDILIGALGPPRPAPGYGPYHDNISVLPLARFVSRYAIGHFDLGMSALYEMTRRFTAEFDIRPFLVKYPSKSYSVLQAWCDDGDLHVRRLVAEGTRPRLPWAQRLAPKDFDPGWSLQLLARLKDDPELYVRRSVANHLGDLLKDDAQSIYPVLEQWQLVPTPSLPWVLKHALRHPAARGDPRALRLLGCDERPLVRAGVVSLEPARLHLGGALNFSVRLESVASSQQTVAVHYLLQPVGRKDKGSLKRYSLWSGTVDAYEALVVKKARRVSPLATRGFSPGAYELIILVNGKPLCSRKFRVT